MPDMNVPAVPAVPVAPVAAAPVAPAATGDAKAPVNVAAADAIKVTSKAEAAVIQKIKVGDTE